MSEPRMCARTLPRSKTVTTTDARNDVLNDVFCNHHTQPEHKQKQRVREKLLETLLALNVSQFETCISLLLQSLDYQDIQIMRGTVPRRRSHKGRNGHGGFDLSARCSTFSPSLTLVQAKQYKRPVSRRFVDELRGAMIRQGAQSGLLITTSTFPDGAQASARENHLLPIALIDGQGLLDLMFRSCVGVRCRWNKRRILWQLDRAFFRDLLPKP